VSAVRISEGESDEDEEMTSDEEGSERGDDSADDQTNGDGVLNGAGVKRGAAEADVEDSDDDDDDSDSPAMTTVTLPHWKLAPEGGRQYFLQGHAKVVCACFHPATGILTVGFSNGVFSLYELPSFSVVHTLSISQKRINTVAVNASGEWLAFGAAKLGQLLVWEWQSESYILKQQGHFYDMSVVAYSPDGHVLGTGGDDGKVKLWSTTSGFCYVTFKDHTGPITGLAFAQSGLALVSSSLDGTVRAFDTIRYRNFRTFTSPQPTQVRGSHVSHMTVGWCHLHCASASSLHAPPLFSLSYPLFLR
jgi:periodic tryptophan protein 2